MIAATEPVVEPEVELAGMLREVEELSQFYYTFTPRRNQPDRFDQQESFVTSKASGVSFLIGGNGAGTTECAMHKLARFVLHEQEPPRRDTPFWIISGTYPQVMKTAWVEKLYGHGHIPKSEIDWDRVAWYRPNQNWPFRVPLKPWPGKPGKNWVLEFKSYEQGREQMQAEAIGGFCFIEQFPYTLLTEVLRGCREYNFPGSKFCEFTPIDPAMSAEIEQRIEDGLPEGWEVWRANTECAKEAGHVSESWFKEFYGMVPEEMLLTRLIGAFASYEGCIYQGFNPQVHIVDDDVIDHPSGVFYRRGLDWGAGPDNPLACVFGYRNGLGQWHIFDEYYSSNQNFTVMDHLAAIADQVPWPVNNPQYGTTYADPSSPDCIRIAQSWGMPISNARNAVYEGIDYVRYLLKRSPTIHQPMLFIHKRCKNLLRQMRTYRWIRPSDSGVNPRDARREPLKKDDHAVDALRYLVVSEAVGDKAFASSMKRPVNVRRHGIQLSTRD